MSRSGLGLGNRGRRGAAAALALLLGAAAAGCSPPKKPMLLPGGGDMGTGGGGDGGPVTLAIAPQATSLAFGQTQAFSANRAVTWSVEEAGGGQIGADGRYTAPFVPGTYHVRAATNDAPAESATATVSVSEHALTLVAGSFGGRGDADGVGTAARTAAVRGLTWDGSQYIYFADGGAVRRYDVGSGEVVTIAGRARWWTGNVDAVGADAKFGLAWGVALDGQGSLYVSDFDNDTIRKIDLKTRAVTTVAGAAGVPGLTNGVGTAARFSAPTGLAFDRAANKLYISDAHNGSIRVYDPANNGQVTLLTYTLHQPDGIVSDGQGTLYVADAGSRQVLAVDVKSQAVTPLAGAGRGFRDGLGLQARFDAPGQLTFEGGALYVADTMAVRRVDPATGLVTSLPVRGGEARSMTGIVGDGLGHVYAGSLGDNAIWRLAVADGSGQAVVGPEGTGIGNVDGVGAAARFFDPGHLLAAPSGLLYVSDVDNGEVRTVDLGSARVTTLLGASWQGGDVDGVGRQARLDNPASVASDRSGNLYVVEPNTGTIRRWNIASNSVTTLAGRAYYPGVADGVGAAARFDFPVAACVDGGALYVADQQNYSVRKVTLASGAVATLAGSSEDPGQVDDVGAAARFALPAGIACDGNGYVYVSDAQSYAIRRIELASGKVDTVVGTLGGKGWVDKPGKDARFTWPAELAYANGFLYVVDDGSGDLHVRKIQLGSWDVQTIASSSASGQHYDGIAVDDQGTVYLANQQFANSTVQKVVNGALVPVAGSSATGNGLVIDGVGTAANFFGAGGLAFDGQGALYVGEGSAEVVRKIDLATSTVTTPLGVGPDSPAVAGTGTGAFVYAPTGLAFGDAGTLFVGDTTSIDRVTLPGASLSVAAGAPGYGGGSDGRGTDARLYTSAFASDGAGSIYFTGQGSVRRFDVQSGQVDTLAGQEGVTGAADGIKSAAQLYWPTGIASDGAGNLYISDTQNHTIRKLVIATGELSTFAGKATEWGAVDGIGDAARFFLPMGIVYDGQGHLYVADSENGAIRRIEIATRSVSTYVGVLGEKGLQPGALPAHLNAPRGLALLPDGGLAVTDEQAVLVVH